jgi:hypothetical protein
MMGISLIPLVSRDFLEFILVRAILSSNNMSPGNGDFLIFTNEKMGWVKFDIKSNKMFFTPQPNLGVAEIYKIISDLQGKNCLLLIDGSLQSQKKMWMNLRNILENHSDPQLREIMVFHSQESIFERGIDDYLEDYRKGIQNRGRNSPLRG